jgi:hypothetical protein
MYFLVDPVDAAAVKKTFLGLFILKEKKKKTRIDVPFFLKVFNCIFVLGKGTPIPIRMIPGAIRFDFNVVKPDERTSQGDL